MKNVKELYTLESRILDLLKGYPATRKDDMFLYFKYCDTVIEGMTAKIFLDLFLYSGARKLYKVKPFESVSRVRRRVQVKHPELTDVETVESRQEQEAIFVDYAIH